MAIANTIVGFDQLRAIAGSGLELKVPAAGQQFDPTPAEAAEFGIALAELHRAQKHREPDSPDNPTHT